MADYDIEQQEPFPVDRDGRQIRNAVDQPDGIKDLGCCGKFQHSVSKWMLPEDARSKYLERANCCPPPIFIILVSIGEVTPPSVYTTHIPCKYWDSRYRFCGLIIQHAAHIGCKCCHCVNDCIDLL